MTKRRSKLEIIYDILKAIQNKRGIIKPTHLLYKSNLSYKKMIEYVKELKTKNMITEIEIKGKRMYKITDKGNGFVQEYRKLQEFTESFAMEE